MRFNNFLKKNWLAIIIVFLTLFTWYKLVNQVMFGEGYYYFDRLQTFFGNRIDISEYDIFARIIFDILIPIFKDNLALYMTFQLVVMVILNLVFYWTLIVATHKKVVSFTATIIFSTSYIGLFEMLGSGNYQRFVQRVPNLIFLFLAFAFLVKYLEGKDVKKLLISYVFFALGAFLAHFSSFLLPLFGIYPAVWALTQKHKIATLLKVSFLSFPYLLINYFLVSQDSLRPQWSIITFIQQRKDLLEKIVLQFSSLNFPPIFIDKISTIAHPFKDTLILLTMPVIVIYIAGYFIVRRNSSKLKVIYLTSLIMIPIVLFLGLYLGKVNPEFDISGFHYYFLPDYYIGKIDTITAIKGDRYYLVPMFFVATIWASLIYSVLKTRERFLKIFSVVFLSSYVLYNTTLIWNGMDRLMPLVTETKNYISYIKDMKSLFKPTTALVTPDYFMWPSTMIRVFYGYPTMQFVSSRHDWKSQILPQNTDIIIVDYDYRTRTFLNLTSDYKSGKKLIFKSY